MTEASISRRDFPGATSQRRAGLTFALTLAADPFEPSSVRRGRGAAFA